MVQRALICLGLAAALAACSPRDLCIANARAELRTLDRLIAETRATVDRGYAIEERTVPEEVFTRCRDADGDLRPCWVTVPRTERRPVTVDIAAERRKLAQLEDRRAQEAAAAAARIRACAARYPEG
ncbi:hypothetical protein [Rhodosalinus sp.]|uniref:hypothetical protein n=1 Tax=Rhodosalinus sp. TaxID=2047741 RepID=UPI003569309C